MRVTREILEMSRHLLKREGCVSRVWCVACVCGGVCVVCVTCVVCCVCGDS